MIVLHASQRGYPRLVDILVVLLFVLSHTFPLFFSRIYENWEHCVFFKSINTVQNNATILGFVYIHPERSTIYAGADENGIDILEKKLSQIHYDFGDSSKLILSGDFNARTANKEDFIHDDNANYLPLPEYYTPDSFCLSRSTCDTIVNSFGYDLLELCKIFGLHIVNGRLSSDIPSNFTFVSHSGTSVVDYFLVSSELSHTV